MPKLQRKVPPQSPLLKYSLIAITALLILVGLAVRLWLLPVIPVALYHDELDHVFTGEAVARFGTDISGNWQPTQLRSLETLNQTAELPAVFHAAAQLIFRFGAQSAHIPNAFFGLLSVVLLGLIAFQVTGRKGAGIAVSLALLLSPWHVHLSRMTYEATISLFFQLSFLSAAIGLLAARP
ncbi:MAG: hypothetical protein M3Q81_00600, partial [bacterium]|nr:hypothetical protein [bacterium]